MKRLLFSALLLFCSVSIFAQSSVKKSSLYIGLGPSFPVGDFSLKKASDERSGLAATGFYVDLGYQYQLSKMVGVIAVLKGKIHGIAKDALNYSLPDGSGGSMSISTTSWKTGTVLGGLTQTFALSKNKNFAIEFREAAGVQFTSSPEVNVSYNIPGIGSSSGNQEPQSATSFAYMAGLAFKYKLNNNLGLKLYGDFNNSNVSFKGYTATAYGTTIAVPPNKQKTGTVDVGLGLTIGL